MDSIKPETALPSEPQVRSSELVVPRDPKRKTSRRWHKATCADCGKVGNLCMMSKCQGVVRCLPCAKKADAEGRIEPEITYSLNGRVVTYSLNSRVVSKEEFEAADARHNS